MEFVMILLLGFYLGQKYGDLKNYIHDIRFNKKLDAQLKARGLVLKPLECASTDAGGKIDD